MFFNEFAQTIQHKRIKSKITDSKVIDESTKRKFRTRDVIPDIGTCRCRRRKHTRPSNVLYTSPAIDYEYAEYGLLINNNPDNILRPAN